MFSNQVDRFKRREEEDRSGGASRGLSYNKEPVSYNRGESYNSPGGTLRGGYQGGRSREGGGGGSERRNLRLDDRTGRLAKEHLHRSPLLLLPPKLQRRGLVFELKLVTVERVWLVTMIVLERLLWVWVGACMMGWVTMICVFLLVTMIVLDGLLLVWMMGY